MMKGCCLVFLFCIILAPDLPAQNKKIYVSRHDGTKKMLTFGRLGYSNFTFIHHGDCDSLLCCGSGYEICKISKYIIKTSGETGIYYPLFNKAIYVTSRHIISTKNESGDFQFVYKSRRIAIKYYNADSKGNADFIIEIL